MKSSWPFHAAVFVACLSLWLAWPEPVNRAQQVKQAAMALSTWVEDTRIHFWDYCQWLRRERHPARNYQLVAFPREGSPHEYTVTFTPGIAASPHSALCTWTVNARTGQARFVFDRPGDGVEHEKMMLLYLLSRVRESPEQEHL
ncbi:MAG: hypothetical protein GMKNLPBB_02134 [Myxococcota bacterium]|nr:hypothetical protein [Myxococcota bacterium]